MTRSAHYAGDRTFTVSDAEPVPPGPGQVRLDVAYTGICGTDLHILHGAMDAPGQVRRRSSATRCPAASPRRPGRRGLGGRRPRHRDAAGWCGTCPACLAGHSHICHHLNFIGIDSPGSHAAARGRCPRDSWSGCPPTCRSTHAALVEPTAVAVHDVRRAELVGRARRPSWSAAARSAC